MGNPQGIHIDGMASHSASQSNKRENEDNYSGHELQTENHHAVVPGRENGRVGKKLKIDSQARREYNSQICLKPGSLMEKVWGKYNTSMTPDERRSHLATPPDWAPALRHLISYDKVSNNNHVS